MPGLNKHISVEKIELDFPYIIGYLDNGVKKKVDVRIVVKEFERYQYAYPHMKKLLNEEFFYCGKLSNSYSINWHEKSEFVDLDTFVFSEAEEII